MDAPGVDRLGGHEPAEPEPDDRDPVAARRRAQPRDRGRDRSDGGLDASGIGRAAAAVTGARQVDAKGRVTGRGEVVGPRPARPIRAHVVPAPRWGDEHGRRAPRSLGRVVEHAEGGLGARAEIDRSRGRTLLVGHATVTSTSPDRLAAVSRPFRSSMPRAVDRRSIRRAWLGSRSNASSLAVNPGTSMRRPWTSRPS